MSRHVKLPKVDCSRGTPMGRPNRWPSDWKNLKPLMLTRLPRDKGGYDNGGAYFGVDHHTQAKKGVPQVWHRLWMCYSMEKDEQGMPLLFLTVWAKSRGAAWRHTIAAFPGVVHVGLANTKGLFDD